MEQQVHREELKRETDAQGRVSLRIASETVQNRILTWHRVTAMEWITSIAVFACAYWTMVIHTTVGIEATRSGARVGTLAVNACFIEGAIRTGCTFGMAVWWASNIITQARANCLAIRLATLTIGTTWRGYTWIDIFLNHR